MTWTYREHLIHVKDVAIMHFIRVLETFNSLGIEFVSPSESLDTATPAGRMVFTVLGVVAELERSLIVAAGAGRAEECRRERT